MPSIGVSSMFALAALQPLLAAPASWGGEAADVTGLFQSGLRLGSEALTLAGSTPTMSLENMDFSAVASKVSMVIQGKRIHTSSMFLNNLSVAVYDLHQTSRKQLDLLKRAIKKHNATDDQKVWEAVAQFLRAGQEAVVHFVNTTGSKLREYLAIQPTEDAAWLEAMSAPIMGHMERAVSPMYAKVQLLQGQSDSASRCETVASLLGDLRNIGKAVQERVTPAFNATASLLPTLESATAPGRQKMVKRFSDLAASIIERVASAAAMPEGTLAPVLAQRLHCVGGDIAALVGQHEEEVKLQLEAAKTRPEAEVKSQPRAAPAEAQAAPEEATATAETATVRPTPAGAMAVPAADAEAADVPPAVAVPMPKVGVTASMPKVEAPAAMPKVEAPAAMPKVDEGVARDAATSQSEGQATSAASTTTTSATTTEETTTTTEEGQKHGEPHGEGAASRHGEGASSKAVEAVDKQNSAAAGLAPRALVALVLLVASRAA